MKLIGRLAVAVVLAMCAAGLSAAEIGELAPGDTFFALGAKSGRELVEGWKTSPFYRIYAAQENKLLADRIDKSLKELDDELKTAGLPDYRKIVDFFRGEMMFAVATRAGEGGKFGGYVIFAADVSSCLGDVKTALEAMVEGGDGKYESRTFEGRTYFYAKRRRKTEPDTFVCVKDNYFLYVFADGEENFQTMLSGFAKGQGTLADNARYKQVVANAPQGSVYAYCDAAKAMNFFLELSQESDKQRVAEMAKWRKQMEEQGQEIQPWMEGQSKPTPFQQIFESIGLFRLVEGHGYLTFEADKVSLNVKILDKLLEDDILSVLIPPAGKSDVSYPKSLPTDLISFSVQQFYVKGLVAAIEKIMKVQIEPKDPNEFWGEAMAALGIDLRKVIEGLSGKVAMFVREVKGEGDDDSQTATLIELANPQPLEFLLKQGVAKQTLEASEFQGITVYRPKKGDQMEGALDEVDELGLVGKPRAQNAMIPFPMGLFFGGLDLNMAICNNHFIVTGTDSMMRDTIRRLKNHDGSDPVTAMKGGGILDALDRNDRFAISILDTKKTIEIIARAMSRDLDEEDGDPEQMRKIIVDAVNRFIEGMAGVWTRRSGECEMKFVLKYAQTM